MRSYAQNCHAVGTCDIPTRRPPERAITTVGRHGPTTFQRDGPGTPSPRVLFSGNPFQRGQISLHELNNRTPRRKLVPNRTWAKCGHTRGLPAGYRSAVTENPSGAIRETPRECTPSFSFPLFPSFRFQTNRSFVAHERWQPSPPQAGTTPKAREAKSKTQRCGMYPMYDMCVYVRQDAGQQRNDIHKRSGPSIEKDLNLRFC